MLSPPTNAKSILTMRSASSYVVPIKQMGNKITHIIADG